MKTTNEPTPVIINAFDTVLRQHRKGKFLGELSAALQEAVLGVRECPGTATISVTLKITPAGRDNALVVVDEIKVKIPQPENKGIWYGTEDGALVRVNPDQTEMKLSAVEEPAALPQTKIA